jgi:hypothetical protein
VDVEKYKLDVRKLSEVRSDLHTGSVMIGAVQTNYNLGIGMLVLGLHPESLVRSAI